MKKLSFIMAVLMILMCMPIMAITSISAAEEAPDANAPAELAAEKVTGAGYVLYSFENDEEAVKAGAIGRYTKAGGNGYAKTFAEVGASAASCGATVFYLITDCQVNRLGDTTALHVGGRKLVVDGSLGQLSTSKSNFRIYAADNTRLVHVGYSSAGELTFKNINFEGNTNDSMIQVNADSSGSKVVTVNFDGCTITNKNVGNNASALVYSNYGTVSNCVIRQTDDDENPGEGNGKAVNIHANGADAKFVNCDIYGEGYAMYFNANSTVEITDCNIQVGNPGRSATQWNSGLINMTINSGNFTGNYGFVMNSGVVTGSVCNIYGGTFNATGAAGIHYQAKGDVTVNIYGGTFKCANRIAYITTTAGNAGALNLNVYGGNFSCTKGNMIEMKNLKGNVVNVYGGTFQAAQGGHAIYVDNAYVNEINIYGGTFVGEGTRMIRLTNASSAGSTLNISGGTFVARNFDIGMGKENFSGTPTPQSGLIFAECNNKINITGGTFTVYKDNGVTLATDCAFVYCWNSDTTKYNPSISVSGGSFNGGLCFVADVVYSGNKEDPIDMEKSKFYYYTEGSNGVALEPKATQGASVRLDKDSSGLRFTATIDGLAIKYIEENLIKEGTKLSYGTMIVPSDYVKYAGGVLTMEAFDKAGKAYLNIEAKDGVIVNEDGSVTINAAMINIKEENYKRDFIAVAYIKYTDTTGAEVIKYATNVNLAGFSRNVQEIAHAALADVLTTAAGTYVNKVDGYYTWNQNARKYEFTPGVAYSRYNAEQLAVLKSYIVD